MTFPQINQHDNEFIIVKKTFHYKLTTMKRIVIGVLNKGDTNTGLLYITVYCLQHPVSCLPYKYTNDGKTNDIIIFMNTKVHIFHFLYLH